MRTVPTALALAPSRSIPSRLLVAAMALAIVVGFSVAMAHPARAASYTFNVTTTSDLHTNHVTFMGVCSTSTSSDSLCSLRAAIEEAQLDPTLTDTFTINVPAGSYVLSNAGTFQQLTINNRNVTIIGAGPTSTIVDHGPSATPYSVFLTVGSQPVSIKSLAIKNGNNTAAGGGGGIRNSIIVPGTLALDGVYVQNNKSSTVGGGISNLGVMTVTNSVIGGPAPSNFNTAATLGGGISDGFDARTTLTDVTVSYNTVTGANGEGGGAFFSAGASVRTVNRVTFQGNQASGASGLGGGLYVDGAVDVTNATFNGNSATSSGSAVSVGFPGVATLLNVTISGNNTTAAGGGAIDNPDSTLRLKNTLVALNTPRDCPVVGLDVTSLGHNLSGDATCNTRFNGTGDLRNVGDPKLGPLASNGGATQTMALLAGSPAIDKGDNVGCPATDQRGVARPATAANPCDIGAYEFVATPALPNTAAPKPRPVQPETILFVLLLATPLVLVMGAGLARRRRARHSRS